MTFGTIPASIVSWRTLLCPWLLTANIGSTHQWHSLGLIRLPEAGARFLEIESALSVSSYEGTGEGGIRTLGSLLGYGALAKRCFQPLSHLTKIVATGRATSLRYELRLGKQARDSRRESRVSRRIRLFQSAICPCQHRPWSRARDFIGVANCRLLIEMIGSDQRRRSASANFAHNQAAARTSGSTCAGTGLVCSARLFRAITAARIRQFCDGWLCG